MGPHVYDLLVLHRRQPSRTEHNDRAVAWYPPNNLTNILPKELLTARFAEQIDGRTV